MAPVQYFRSHRRLSVLLGVFLLLIALVAAGEIAGWPFLRGPLEDRLSRQMERSVRVSPPFHLRFLGGLHLKAGGLWISAPAEFELPHFLDARDITLRLRYRDLWQFKRSGALRIASLDVGQMDARLVRTAAGDASWRLKKPSPDEESPPLPIVDLLRVGQGSIVFRDPALQADLRALFDTREGEERAAPVAHMEAQGTFRRHPLKAQLETSGWLPATAHGSDAPPTSAKGWITYGGVRADFDGTVKDLFGRRGIQGRLTVKGPSLGLFGLLFGAPLPTTSPFSFQGTIDKDMDVWRTNIVEAHIGRSALSANFTYDPGQKPPRLDGELGGKNLALADLGPAFGTRSEEGTPLRPRPGHLLPNRPLDLPSLKNLDARVTVNLERVDLGSAFREPIQPFKAVLTLDGGKMGLAKVDARTAQGRLRGDISVDARSQNPRWQADLAWEGIRLENWLKSAEARKAGPADDSPPYFAGILQGRAKLAGTGRSTVDLLGSLDGDITMFVRNGTLSHLVIEVLGLDVAQGLGLVMRGDESLPVRCAVVDLQARNGSLTPRVALVDTPVTLILADGRVNLGKESLDLRLTAKPKNISPFTLRSPIRVQGSFAEPRTAPEPGPIAARVVGGLALAAVAPLAAILPFIDPGDSGGSPCGEVLTHLKR